MIDLSNVGCHADVINLKDERPTIMFGPHIENTKDFVALFYIILTVHDHLLHNCMLDSGGSHNLMPKYHGKIGPQNHQTLSRLILV
jgi:hypothetical protein